MPVLSPVPEKSPNTTEEKMVTQDWIRWFLNLREYVGRILNRYDSSRSGFVVLENGSVTVNNTTVTESSALRMTPQNEGSGTPGHLAASIVPGISFTIVSSEPTDDRTVFYEILEVF